jgi:hypothetical protein
MRGYGAGEYTQGSIFYHEAREKDSFEKKQSAFCVNSKPRTEKPSAKKRSRSARKKFPVSSFEEKTDGTLLSVIRCQQIVLRKKAMVTTLNYQLSICCAKPSTINYQSSFPFSQLPAPGFPSIIASRW